MFYVLPFFVQPPKGAVVAPDFVTHWNVEDTFFQGKDEEQGVNLCEELGLFVFR